MGGSESKKKEYLLESLGDHIGAINCMALSGDESLLVTGSEDYTLRMWSTKALDTECFGELKGHTSYITCVTISDTFIISGSADNSIRKWDMNTCECLVNYMGHESRISRLLVTKSYIYSTSYDKTVKVWDLNIDEEFDDYDPSIGTRACVRTFIGHSRGVYSIIFIPGGEETEFDEEGLNINPGDCIITGSADNTARSWSIATAATLIVFKGHKGPISSMSTDPEGKILYTGSLDRNIRSWNISTGLCLQTMSGHSGAVISLVVANRLVYSGSQDAVARCWYGVTGDCTRSYNGHTHSISAIIFYEGILYTACGDTCARAFDAKSGRLKRLFEGHDSALTCMKIVGEKLYTGSLDKTLRVWDLSDIHKDPDATEDFPDNEVSNESEDIQNKRFEGLDKPIDNYEEDDVAATAIPTN